MKVTHLLLTFLASAACANAAVSVTSSSLGYAYSGFQNNNYGGDGSGFGVWTAGSQRSDNGGIDPNNHRAGRVFLQFTLDQPIIDEAGLPGATLDLTFFVDSIGAGVSGTPYTDGLDLRYLNVHASSLTLSGLWGTTGVGADQADILAVGGATGSHTITLSDPTIVLDIASATAGDVMAFGMSNSTGVNTGVPVGSSTAETYGFQINKTTSNHSLTVNAVPEPSSSALIGLGAAALLLRRRK
ncbi:MAG: PEP-CTERM sorting domain-containing protein [Akkermansiaceae bacterium]